MKTKYYFYGTILGLCLVPAVLIYLLGSKELLQLVFDGRFALPFAIGYAAAFAAGSAADRWIQGRGFFATVLVLIGVFLAGVLFGCLANLFINGQLLSPSYRLAGEVFDWVVKPAFWFSIIGVPCALIVGVIHYLAHQVYVRWRGSRSVV